MLNQELKYISAGENLIDFDRLRDDTGIPRTKIAEALNISRASLTNFERRGTVRDIRAKIISNELKNIKKNLTQIIKELDQAIKEDGD